MNTIRVVQNLHTLSVHGLINRAKQICQNINDNISRFPACVAALAKVSSDTAELEQADLDAADGGKTKTAIRYDKERQLRESLTVLGNYVQEAAQGDEALVHLAGMELRAIRGGRAQQEFAVGLTEGGGILLKTRRHAGAIYKWMYCTDPLASNSWTEAGRGKTSRFNLSGLAPGLYWFKVVYIDADGEREEAPIRYAVN